MTEFQLFVGVTLAFVGGLGIGFMIGCFHAKSIAMKRYIKTIYNNPAARFKQRRL